MQFSTQLAIITFLALVGFVSAEPIPKIFYERQGGPTCCYPVSLLGNLPPSLLYI